MSFLVAAGGLLITCVSFILGKSVAETEKIFAEKRRVYEEFLRVCPRPNEAYETANEDLPSVVKKVETVFPVLILYASPAVTLAVSEYLNAFADAAKVLTPDSPPLHDAYRRAGKAHNDIVLEMRRDAFSWSFFAHRGKSRLPQDALERASKNSL